MSKKTDGVALLVLLAVAGCTNNGSSSGSASGVSAVSSFASESGTVQISEDGSTVYAIAKRVNGAGSLTTLRVMVLGSAVAMPALFVWREQVLLLYLLVAVVYWCYGTQLSVFASTTADLYGTRNLGMNYGLLFTAWGTAGIIGPIIAARVFDAFGDYRYAFYAASVLALVAFASLILAGAKRSTVAVVEPQRARAARQ